MFLRDKCAVLKNKFLSMTLSAADGHIVIIGMGIEKPLLLITVVFV